MDTPYLNKISITLEPVWNPEVHTEAPKVFVGINDYMNESIIEKETTFNFDFDATEDTYNLNVDFVNKTDADTVPGENIDKAVIIKSIEIFGITDRRFIWQGIYTPKYPEMWAAEQLNKGVVLKQHLKNQTYLGWNGRWSLEFTVPIFTWVHNVQNLGWIYR